MKKTTFYKAIGIAMGLCSGFNAIAGFASVNKAIEEIKQQSLAASQAPEASRLQPNIFLRPRGYYDQVIPQQPKQLDVNFEGIINTAKDFITNYSHNASLEAGIQTALEHIPYRALGITVDEVNQIKNGLIPASIKNKVNENIHEAILLFNKIQPQLKNLPIAIALMESYLTQAVSKEHLTQEVLNALNKVRDFALKNNDLLMKFGNKLADILEKNQNFLLKNLNIDKINTSSINDIINRLNELANIIKPDIEKLINDLNQADKNQINDLLNTFKSIKFDKIKVKEIEADIVEFLKKTMPGIV
ncbi:MAG: hypothetical protein WC707_04625 [Candidatus Babeliaceae bacterium]|jgi:hypothetical protein